MTAADPAAPVLTRCPKCGGVGIKHAEKSVYAWLIHCPTCHGTGQIPAGQTEEIP